MRHVRSFRDTVPKVLPGVLICVIIGLATTFISEHYGGPVMLYALLFGISIHFLYAEGGRAVAGVEFASRTILRLGVALLGTRITISQVAELGIGPIITVIVGVTLTILSGVALARVLGLQKDLGMLTGGSVAICGASAALALSAVMPRHENHERNTIMTVVSVTALSTAAMVIYPLFVSVLNMTDNQAGVFLGGTIHDVAQVVGAGYIISQETGDISTFVKLLRVAMLVPAVMCFMFVFSKQNKSAAGDKKVPLLPGFLVGFVVLVIINSLGLIPEAASASITTFSGWCLVTAIAGLGIKTSFQKLAEVGWKPIVLIVLETLILLVIVFAFIYMGGVGS
ncbi:putative sulfate exporter family transporter [Pistricoccus aurantiacus]|uniref:Putative sulfate exporter family transporter n=2 Tax=Pistricoccus aurantiacus TaxID=1883414 RepID=A0A5B8SY09_9GAMM|nr:putative sulfate exporter family transporter [Pistricoccus aurantiacus]